MKKMFAAMALGAALALPAGEALAGKDLDAVKARGQLVCGVAVGGIAGFMVVDNQGKWTGMNVDICRGVSAALFGDSEKVKYVRCRASSASPRCRPVRSTSCRTTRPGR
jgi:general L-amino acid transport system substrate-binding protein